MSYWVETEITELELKIPKKDFPLESDVVVGRQNPHIMFPCSEDSESVYPSEEGDFFVWRADEDNGIYARENGECAVEELADLCEKYGGTLVAIMNGEEGESEHIRVRDGKRKKIKIVEE